MGEGLDWFLSQSASEDFLLLSSGTQNLADGPLDGAREIQPYRTVSNQDVILEGVDPPLRDKLQSDFPYLQSELARVVEVDGLYVGLSSLVDLHLSTSAVEFVPPEGVELLESDDTSNWASARIKPTADREAVYGELLAHNEIVEFDPEFIFWEKPDLFAQTRLHSTHSNSDSILQTIRWDWELISKINFSQDVAVAIIDSGIDQENPLFQDTNIEYFDSHRWRTESPERRTIRNPHGTRCAGVISARQPALGLCSGLQLIDCHAWHSGSGAPGEISYSTHIWRTLKWLRGKTNVRAVNISLRMPPHSRISRELQALATFGGNGLGVVICAASGNNGGSVAYPARLPDVTIAVGGCNSNGHIVTESLGLGWATAVGPALDILAPSISIPTTDMLAASTVGRTTNFNKTSAATPIATSVSALCVLANPLLHGKDIRSLIRDTGYNTDQSGDQLPHRVLDTRNAILSSLSAYS